MEDRIVDISEARERFFGCSGKMLIPSQATVEALIKEIPQNKLITTELLRQELAERHRVQVTCPATTQKALKAIAHESDCDVAYWRVIKKSGEMIAQFPGGVTGHAARLTAESFTIDATGKTLKVTGFKERLIQFDIVLGTNQS